MANKGFAKIEMLEVKPIVIVANITTDKDLDIKTGQTIDIKHDGNIHTVTVTTKAIIFPVADITSQTIWKITTPNNDLFLRPASPDLIALMVNFCEIAAAHNRGIFEMATMTSEFQGVQTATPRRQDIASKISFDIDKYLLNN